MDWDVFCDTLILPLHLLESQSAHSLLSWGSCRETGIGLLKSHGGPGRLHSSSVSLSFYHTRGSQFCFLLMFQLRAIFSNAFPPYSKCIVPSTMAVYLFLGFCWISCIFLLNPACWLFAFRPPLDNDIGEIALHREWLLVCTGCQSGLNWFLCPRN